MADRRKTSASKARARGADAERLDARARASGAHPKGKVRHRSSNYVANARGGNYWRETKRAERSERRRGAAARVERNVRRAVTGSSGRGSSVSADVRAAANRIRRMMG